MKGIVLAGGSGTRLYPSTKVVCKKFPPVSDSRVLDIARDVKPSARSFAWLDSGTPDSLVAATNFVKAVADRQRLKIPCIEKSSFRLGFIDRGQLLELAEALKKSSYGDDLFKVAREGASL